MNSNKRRLTAKERAFAEEYVQNGYNATQAYLTVYNCGYNTANATGYRKLLIPEVKEYVLKLQKDAFDRECITAERIATKLAEIAFACKDDESYVASAQLKAIDLLQKQLGLQTQKVDANVKTTITVDIEDGD